MAPKLSFADDIDTDTDEFPAFYQTEDYFECIQNGDTFCTVVGKLGLGSGCSSVWENIKRYEHMPWKLDRSYIQRGLCLLPAAGDLVSQARNYVNEEISVYNLTTTKIHMFHCQEYIPSLSNIDRSFLTFVAAICFCISIGTLLDLSERKHIYILEKILLKFSLRESWKKITQTTGNEDFNRLKSIQGLRVFTMFCIILTHAGVDIMLTFYSNPESFETSQELLVQKIFSIFSMLLVHIFLTISAFLLAHQMWSHYEQNGSFSFKELIILVTNRYLRLIIPTLLLVAFAQTSIMEPYLGVPTLRLYLINKRACETNWISTILFYSNFQHMQDICFSHTWYLSADFQAYLLLAVVLYVVLKFKLDFIKVTVTVLVCSTVAFGVVLYVKDKSQIIFQPILREVQHNTIDYDTFLVLYTATYSTLPTSVTGFIFGYLYFKKRKVEIVCKKLVYQLLWIVLFFGLPSLSIGIAVFKYNRIITAILGSMVKVILANGIGIGIIGMSHGLGGYIKTILEGKHNLFLGNISFTTYLFNYLVLLFSNIGNTELKTLSPLYVLTKMLLHISISLLGGLAFSFVVEYPAMAIQKMYWPQLKKK